MNPLSQSYRKFLRILAILFAAVGLCSCLLFVPQVRECIIAFAESRVGRPLTHDVWHARIVAAELKLFAAIFLLALGAALFSFLEFCDCDDGIFHFRTELKSIKESKLQWMCILAVFVLLVSARLFYISQKKTMHVDEGMSIAICNRNEYGFWGKDYELYKEYTGKELKGISFFDNASVLDSLSDVFHMHQNNNDSPHTNFYYSALRLWFTGVKTCDLRYIFWRACLLNVFLFSLSFIFMTLLLKRFTNNSAVLSLCLFAAFINPEALSITVFMRPYELQQTFVIVLFYYVVCALQAVFADSKIETKKNFVIGAFVLALATLAAYFNLILIVLCGLSIIVLCVKKKNWNQLIFFVCMFIASLVLAKILYFNYGNMDYRGSGALLNLAPSNIKLNLIAMKDGLRTSVLKNFFFVSYCALACLAGIWTVAVNARRRENAALSMLLGLLFAGMFAFFFFAPIDMKELRYIAPLFFCLSLCFVNAAGAKIPKAVLPGFASLLLLLSLVPSDGEKYVVEHLDDSHIDVYNCLKDSSLTVFIRGRGKWQYSCLVPYLSDDSKVVFIEDFSEIQEKYSRDLPCLFVNQHDTIDYGFESGELCVQKLSEPIFHDVYLVKENAF